MNRNALIALLLLGILLLMGSCVPLGMVVYYETIIDPRDNYLFDTAPPAEPMLFQAKPASLARFSLELDIITRSVQEDPESFTDDYLARFEFPITYSVRDSEGNSLLSRTTLLSWKDSFSINKSDEKTTSTGGTLKAKINFDKFTVPADGSISFDVEISPDSIYEASYSSGQLYLYDELIDYLVYITAGVCLFLIGIILSLASFILLLIHSAQTINNTDPALAVVSDNDKARQDAMIIQLSALSGYVVPLGSLIVPLVLWQLWRGRDSYIDEMGREAVNFEISMIIYYFISLVLCLLIIGILLIFALAIFHLAYIIIASVHTSRGRHFRYPLTLRLIK